LSRTATGALIVVERQTKLGEQIDTGTIIKAVPSAELLCNIFFHNSPLHDGAVIIRDGIIYAAGCFLPKPQDEESIPKELGTRHRAGIGMSENCDAVVIIVSEETGIVSVAENGTLYRSFNSEKLRQLLTERLQKNTTAKPAKRTKNKSGKKEDKQ
jgi:diadenylate cyclase